MPRLGQIGKTVSPDQRQLRTEEPFMARLKRIMESALEDRSVRFLLSTIALAVAVSLIAGFAIGYRVEESRIKPVKKVATRAAGTATPTNSRFTTAPDLTGAVYAPVKKGVLIVVRN